MHMRLRLYRGVRPALAHEVAPAPAAAPASAPGPWRGGRPKQTPPPIASRMGGFGTGMGCTKSNIYTHNVDDNPEFELDGKLAD